MVYALSRLSAWRLVYLILAGIGASLAYFLIRDGWSDEGLRGIIRVTARSSLTLFLGAFAASSLALLMPSDPTRWLLANRRYIGIAFAISHLIHGAAIITLAIRTGGGSLTARVVGLSGAGLLYGFILFMLITSFDRPTAWVGPRIWKAVHKTGSYLIFVTFLATYGRKATESQIFLIQVIALLAVFGLRMARRFRASRRG